MEVVHFASDSPGMGMMGGLKGGMMAGGTLDLVVLNKTKCPEESK